MQGILKTEKMSSLNILPSTSGQQQIIYTPILANNAGNDSSGIIFADNPIGTKTIVLQDGQDLPPGVEYTLIEDPNHGSGGYLQISNTGQGKKIHILFLVKEKSRMIISFLIF